MSSTKKGDKFEAEIFNLLTEEIKNNRFYVRKDCCRIYQKKGYYSKDRGKEIIFDIAIEVYLPSQKTLSHLILIECKKYNHPVPVDDIEEFYQKMQQISGGNIKGIIASSCSFQEGAFNFSKSKGLGLLRYFKRSELKWELTRSPSTLVSSTFAVNEIARHALTDPSFISDFFDCYSYIDGLYASSFNLFLSELIKFNSSKEILNQLSLVENKVDLNPRNVPFKRERQIESLCSAILRKVNYVYGPAPLDKICAMLKKEDGLRVVHRRDKSSKLGKDLLGKITFDPFQITIYKDDEGKETREKYTLAHEIGHYFLGHSKYMTRELCKKNDIDLDNPSVIGVKDIVSMEWQANFFASCLLLPHNVFIQDFLRLVSNEGLTNRGFGILYLDNQRCNWAHFYNITDALIRKYDVSRRVVTIRLKRLGFLHESHLPERAFMPLSRPS